MGLVEYTAGGEDNIILSIGLLVSNRRDSIRQCLDSLMPLREAVNCQLILIDTGCDADLRLLLEEYGDVVADFTWCNDFSAARNESLRYARGEWFLYLDDDEWFTQTAALCDFFASGEYKQYASASYIQRNYLDFDGSQYTDNWVARMTKIFPDTHFESKIHEYIVPDEGKHKYIKAIVDHYGYVYPTEEAKRKHFERNTSLLEEMMKTEPAKERWYLQMLLEYRTMEDYDRLKDLGQKGLGNYSSRVFATGTLAERMYVGSFYAARILAAMGKNDFETTLCICEDAERDERTMFLFRIFLHWAKAKSFFYMSKYSKAISETTLYLEGAKQIEADEEDLQGQQIAPFVGECLDLVKKKEMYSVAICSGLRLGDTTYLEKYLPCLEWNDGHIYVFEEIVPILVAAMCTLERKTIYEELIGVIYGHAGLWEYFCGQVQEYEAEGNDVSPIMTLIRDIIPEALVEEPSSDVSVSQEMVNDETQALITGIKEQLRMLIANGMKGQAKAVFEQIRPMLPRDEDVIELEKTFLE